MNTINTKLENIKNQIKEIQTKLDKISIQEGYQLRRSIELSNRIAKAELNLNLKKLFTQNTALLKSKGY